MTALTVVLSEATRGKGPAHRTRVVLKHPASGAMVVDEHLRLELPTAGTWSLLADVLLATGTGQQDIAKLRTRNPGALVIAVHRGPRCWMWTGCDGLTLSFRARPLSAIPPWGICASLAHTWLVAGLPVATLESATVRVVQLQSPERLSSCASWVRTVWAPADSEPPTEEYRSSASR